MTELFTLHQDFSDWDAEQLGTFLAATDPTTLPDPKKNYAPRPAPIEPVREGEGWGHRTIYVSGFLAELPPQATEEFILRGHAIHKKRPIENVIRYEVELARLGALALENGLPNFVLPHNTFVALDDPYTFCSKAPSNDLHIKY